MADAPPPPHSLCYNVYKQLLQNNLEKPESKKQLSGCKTCKNQNLESVQVYEFSSITCNKLEHRDYAPPPPHTHTHTSQKLSTPQVCVVRNSVRGLPENYFHQERTFAEWFSCSHCKCLAHLASARLESEKAGSI